VDGVPGVLGVPPSCSRVLRSINPLAVVLRGLATILAIRPRQMLRKSSSFAAWTWLVAAPRRGCPRPACSISCKPCTGALLALRSYCVLGWALLFVFSRLWSCYWLRSLLNLSSRSSSSSTSSSTSSGRSSSSSSKQQRQEQHQQQHQQWQQWQQQHQQQQQAASSIYIYICIYIYIDIHTHIYIYIEYAYIYIYR